MEASFKPVTAEDLAGDIESIKYTVSYKRPTLTAEQMQSGSVSFSVESCARAACCSIRMKNGWFVVGDGPVRPAAEYDEEAEKVAAYNAALAQLVERYNFVYVDRQYRAFLQVKAQYLGHLEMATRNIDEFFSETASPSERTKVLLGNAWFEKLLQIAQDGIEYWMRNRQWLESHCKNNPQLLAELDADPELIAAKAAFDAKYAEFQSRTQAPSNVTEEERAAGWVQTGPFSKALIDPRA